jgi:hypothetical protein
MESVQHVQKKIQYLYLLKKYKKWGVLKVAVCPSYIQDAGFLKVKQLHTLPVLHFNRCFFLFFFLRRYNFGEVLAFSTNSFHLERFLM